MVVALDGPTLAKILQYHVLPTKKLAADLVAGGATQPTIYTFENTATTLALDTSAGVKITDEVLTQANVSTADVPATNGVIHVIDKVLVPPGVLNLVQMAQLNPTFSVLVEAVVAANLATTLDGPGVFTVFAPTNGAFTARLGQLNLTKAQLLANAGLADILKYHVLNGNVRAAAVVALPKPASVTTLQGSAFTVGTTLAITDIQARTANLVATDVIASNGVIHVIDAVLQP
jgi:transforming growth factor-beta-induced protein